MGLIYGRMDFGMDRILRYMGYAHERIALIRAYHAHGRSADHSLVYIFLFCEPPIFQYQVRYCATK